MHPLWFVIPALLLAAAVALRRSRHRRLAEIRARWGTPVERTRRIDTLSTSYAARIDSLAEPPGLDVRTWADLNLDAPARNANDSAVAISGAHCRRPRPMLPTWRSDVEDQHPNECRDGGRPERRHTGHYDADRRQHGKHGEPGLAMTSTRLSVRFALTSRRLPA